jgi:hypothetical protein
MRRHPDDWQPFDRGDDFDIDKGIHKQLELDYNKGLTRHCHNSGLTVCVYNDRPGEYFLDNGKPATEEQAALVGIDIFEQRKLRREREVKQRAAEAVSLLSKLNEEQRQQALEVQARAKSERAAELKARAEKLSRQFLENEAKRIAAADGKRIEQMEFEQRHARGRG